MKSEIGVIIAVVVLGIASIIFGVMAFMNSSEINGESETKSKDYAIKDLGLKVKDLQDKIDEYREKIAQKSRTLDSQRDEYARLAAERDDIIRHYASRLQLKNEGGAFTTQAGQVNGEVTQLKAKTLAAINKENSAERERMDAQVEVANKAKTEAQARVLKIKEDLTKDQKAHLADMNYQRAQLSDAKDVLKDLTQREAVHVNIHDNADGKVILSDPPRNFYSINIGTGMGVKNGMRFEVYTMLAGNKHKRKAFLEVQKAGAVQSDCFVVQRPIEMPIDSSGFMAEEPEMFISPYAQSGKKGASADLMTGSKIVMTGASILDPIVEGDLIQNPFFSASRPLTFYIAGSKEMVGERQKSAIRYRWTEIKAAAESYGAKVVGTVNTEVNYVIAQKNPSDDPEYKIAVDLGIPIIYEWELFRFLDNK